MFGLFVAVSAANAATMCTMEYAPVCGQSQIICNKATGVCTGSDKPTTYSNTCMMNAAGATFLYSGECSNGGTVITRPLAKIELTDAGAPSIGNSSELKFICEASSYMSISRAYNAYQGATYVYNADTAGAASFSKVIQVELGATYKLYCGDNNNNQSTSSYSTPDYLATKIELSAIPIATTNAGSILYSMNIQVINGPVKECNIFVNDVFKQTLASGVLSASIALPSTTSQVYAVCKYSNNSVAIGSTQSNTLTLGSGSPTGTECPKGSFTDESCICPNGVSPVPVPSGTRIQQFTCDTGSVYVVYCSVLDVDGDGKVQALVDGVLIQRALNPYLSDANLWNGIIPSGNSTRKTGAEVRAFVNSNLSKYDVDGDGKSLPTTDGILITRYMLGISGSNFLQDISVAPGVTYDSVVSKIKSACGQDTTMCTAVYSPVCGRPTTCDSASGYCTSVLQKSQTYSNLCSLNAAGATFLYSGACSGDNPVKETVCSATGTFTDSSCVCPNGGSPIALSSGTRIQQFTCDTLSVSCTKDYLPVCARARNSCDGLTATNTTACRPAPAVMSTYSNRCEMNKAGAIYMYDGACDTAATTTPPVTYNCPVGTFTSPTCICPNGIFPTPVPSGTRIQQFTCDKSVATSTQPSKFCPTGTFSDPECRCPLGTNMQTVNASTCSGSILMCAQVMAYSCVAIPNYETPPYIPEIPINPTPTVCIEPTVNLGVGSRGTAVTDIQKFLNTNGYLTNTPTGYFGSATRAAVIKFQSENGINTTGYVGQLTRAQVKVKSCEQLVPIPAPQPYTPIETSAVPVPTNTTTVNTSNSTASAPSASVISSINVVAVAPGFSVSSVNVENGNKFTIVFKALDLDFDSPHYVKLVYKNSSKSCILTASFIPTAGKTYNLIRSAESSCILGGVIGALSEIDHIEIVRQ